MGLTGEGCRRTPGTIRCRASPLGSRCSSRRSTATDPRHTIYTTTPHWPP